MGLLPLRPDQCRPSTKAARGDQAPAGQELRRLRGATTFAKTFGRTGPPAEVRRHQAVESGICCRPF